MSYQNPFSTSDKYTNDKIKSRVQARIKRAEQARNNLLKIEEKITDKDKYMTRRGQEPCSLPGYVSNKGGMEKVFDKYEKVSQGNQNYKELCDKKPQLDNYFKNYIDNAKVPKVDFVEEKKIYVDNKKRNQEQIVKDWDNQIKTDNGIRDRIEMNYQERLTKDRNAYEEKYNKQAKIKRDKIKRNTEDYLNVNTKLIEDKTKTTMGTPHYMAPEMILGTGYSFEVDYWAIACCMYEFICGGVPFGDDCEDTMEIYIAIKNE